MGDDGETRCFNAGGQESRWTQLKRTGRVATCSRVKNTEENPKSNDNNEELLKSRYMGVTALRLFIIIGLTLRLIGLYNKTLNQWAYSLMEVNTPRTSVVERMSLFVQLSLYNKEISQYLHTIPSNKMQ